MENKQVIYHISTFSPTQCGIATYTEDLISALAGTVALKARMHFPWAVEAPGFDCTIDIENLDSYHHAVRIINESDAQVVSLQHEFGIYGGQKGSYVKFLLDHIKKPIVTTLHTTTPLLSVTRNKILEHIISRSNGIVALTESSRDYIVPKFGIPDYKIRVINHGVPETSFVYPEETALRKKLNSPLVFFSSGHMRRSKGYDHALESLVRLKKTIPDFRYIILGTHQKQNVEGDYISYKIEKLVKEHGLEENVIRIAEYLPLANIIEYIKASDIGLVTYTGKDQSSSGVMPLILSCGRPVIATAFDYALTMKARLDDCIGIAEINNPKSILDVMTTMTRPDFNLKALMEECYAKTRPFLWQHAAQQYMNMFEQVQSTVACSALAQ